MFNIDKNLNFQSGGKAIDYGGFGCIFKPALKCKGKGESEEGESEESEEGKEVKERKDRVSKLMKKKYVRKEYDDIVKFVPYLKKIPKYEKYFLIKGVSICEPARLSEEDLYDFDSKCKNLVKMKITKKNINENSNLNMLALLNMPYGGINVDDYIEKTSKNGYLDYEKMVELNNGLLELLKNGILPMNKEHIFHCDLKASNILRDNHMNLRLIDWGISCIYDGGAYVPKVLKRRSLQFNLPFSNILFNDRFYNLYRNFLIGKKTPSYLDVRNFVMDFIFLWVKERGPGHLKTINTIMKYLFEDNIKDINNEFKENIIEYGYTLHFIVEYITKILMKFTRNGGFDKIAYLNIFVKNIDIWGFTMTYISIVQIIKKSKKIGKLELDIIDKIREIILFLYDFPDKIINTNKLIGKFKELNIIFKRGVLTSSKREKFLGKMDSFSQNRTLKTGLREKDSKAKGITAKAITAKGNKDNRNNKTKKKYISWIESMYKTSNKKSRKNKKE